jgi:hypothetical protein|uniref:Uncharacterized protein n=1 Tax=viral metagenome TaxID=1070528 RepID=A0A6C0J4Q8_9ZZZZ
MSFIDFSDNDSSNSSIHINKKEDISDSEHDLTLINSSERCLTPSLLKTHEKKYEIDTRDSSGDEGFYPVRQDLQDNDVMQRIQEQINQTNNQSIVYGFAENLEILRNMNEEICERLDWVTRQTQNIIDQVNEDRLNEQKERTKDRHVGLFFSFLETQFFLIGMIYSTILFIIEMYYNFM